MSGVVNMFEGLEERRLLDNGSRLENDDIERKDMISCLCPSFEVVLHPNFQSHSVCGSTTKQSTPRRESVGVLSGTAPLARGNSFCQLRVNREQGNTSGAGR